MAIIKLTDEEVDCIQAALSDGIKLGDIVQDIKPELWGKDWYLERCGWFVVVSDVKLCERCVYAFGVKNARPATVEIKLVLQPGKVRHLCTEHANSLAAYWRCDDGNS
jgi:hypothetical protein